MTSHHPILFRNANFLDGRGNTAALTDILVRDGIWQVSPSAPLPDSTREVDLHGTYVSPGWIDLHTHIFEDHGLFSVSSSTIGMSTGVATLVDAGSAGALNYAVFAKTIPAAREAIFAYVNIASTGIPHGHAARPGFVGDHFHASLHSVELAESLLEHFPDSIVGWKVRLSSVLAERRPELERNALNNILRLRDRTGLPIMVHHVDSTIPSDEVLDHLSERDVYTHLYHGIESTLFNASGAPSHAALAARRRGVVFDVGHGVGAFRWACAEKACQQAGFWPDTISSDLHAYNNFWPVRDLATTMTKFLHLGAPLEQVITMVTGNAARALQRNPLESTLTIFQLEEGNFLLSDADGITRQAPQRIQPLAVVKGGNLTPCLGWQYTSKATEHLAAALQQAATY